MNPQIAPILWFRSRSDAERLQGTLKSSGIESWIRDADDPPSGWRTDASKGGVDLWVGRQDFERADDIVRQIASAHPQMLCDRCHRHSPTFHVTVHHAGVQTTRNLCESCYLAES